METSVECLTFTVAEAAEKLRVSEAWYLRQLRARLLPGRKLGRQWSLTADDIEAALELCSKPALVAPNRNGMSERSFGRLTRSRTLGGLA